MLSGILVKRMLTYMLHYMVINDIIIYLKIIFLLIFYALNRDWVCK